jgi:hypothetical protein
MHKANGKEVGLPVIGTAANPVAHGPVMPVVKITVARNVTKIMLKLTPLAKLETAAVAMVATPIPVGI